MEQINVTKNIYSERIEKSPDFAKDIVIVFSDDVSVETMKKFNKGSEWMEPMIRELILDWNLTDENNKKLSIDLEGLNKIKSIKLRNWIIKTLYDVVLDSLELLKKK